MQSTFEEITPERASQMLREHNTGNRQLRMESVDKLTGEMMAGKWMANGDSIRFAKNGRLLDGQHRLAAVVKSGVTIWSFIVRELEEETFITMDIGKVRTGEDIMFSHGVHDGRNIAALARLILTYRRTGFQLGVGANKGRGKTANITNADILEFIKTGEDVSEHVRQGRVLTQQYKKSYSGAEYAFLHYLFTESNSTRTAEFFRKLAKGGSLEEGDAIWNLRRQIERKIANPKLQVTQFEKLAWAVKTWNYYLKGLTRKMLQFDNLKDNFPTVYMPNKNAPDQPGTEEKPVVKEGDKTKRKRIPVSLDEDDLEDMPDDFEFPGELDQYPESVYGEGEYADEYAD